MKCIAVYPILKTTFSEVLTYWTTFDYKTGDLIQIPLQNRKIWAVVDSVLSVSDAKEFIKSQSFAIRKITEQVTSDFLGHDFLLASLDTSRYYVRSFGEVLAEVVPKHILENLSVVKGENTKTRQNPKRKNTQATVDYLQDTFWNRVNHIQKIVEQRAKKGQYTCLVAPTVESATFLYESLKKNTEAPVSLFHGSISAKKQKETVSAGTIVITPIYLYLLESLDIDLCIMESAGSEYYRHLRKKFDFRYFIRQYAKRKKIELIESDTLLPLYDDQSKNPLVSYKIPREPEVYMVDQKLSAKAKVRDLRMLKKDVKKNNARPKDLADIKEIVGLKLDVVTHKKLALITPELFSLIKYCEQKQLSILLHTVRKGLSSQIICKDCQSLFACPECKKPYQLTEVAGTKMYTCPLNHAPQSIHSRCPTCKGLHLQLFGSGTEAVAKELKDTTTLPIEIIDADTTTAVKTKKLLRYYAEKKIPAIYIGTEFLLNQLQDTRFDYSAIVSLQTLLSLPNRLAELESARVVNTLIEKTEKTVLIQTRDLDQPIWECVSKKNWAPLLRQAKQDAKDLNMPPYSTHLQIIIPLKYKNRQEESVIVADYLSRFGLVHTNVNTERVSLHLFLNRDLWPIDGLLMYLKSLPEYIQIEVDTPALL